MLVAEAIANAQRISGKKDITGSDFRDGLEATNLTADRLKELGLEGLTIPMKASCADHAGSNPIFMTQWDGSEWNRTPNGQVEVLKDEVGPLIQAAAEKYVSDNQLGKPKLAVKAASSGNTSCLCTRPALSGRVVLNRLLNRNE